MDKQATEKVTGRPKRASQPPDERREAILAAACRAIQQRGFANTRIADIAAEADMGGDGVEVVLARVPRADYVLVVSMHRGQLFLRQDQRHPADIDVQQRHHADRHARRSVGQPRDGGVLRQHRTSPGRRTAREDARELRRRAELGLQDAFVLVYSGSIGGWYLTEEMADFFSTLLKVRPDAHFLWLTPGEHDRAHGGHDQVGEGQQHGFAAQRRE